MRETTAARLLAAATAALLLATACGEPGASGRDGSAPEAPGGEPPAGSSPEAPIGSTPSPCDDGAACDPPASRWRRVEPRPGMAGVHPIGFHRAHPDGERAVLVRFYSGVEPCAVLDHVDVAYGRKAITVTLFEGHEPGSEADVCIEVAEAKEVRVPLDEPLGGRDIRDGAPGSGDAPLVY